MTMSSTPIVAVEPCRLPETIGRYATRIAAFAWGCVLLVAAFSKAVDPTALATVLSTWSDTVWLQTIGVLMIALVEAVVGAALIIAPGHRRWASIGWSLAVIFVLFHIEFDGIADCGCLGTWQPDGLSLWLASSAVFLLAPLLLGFWHTRTQRRVHPIPLTLIVSAVVGTHTASGSKVAGQDKNLLALTHAGLDSGIAATVIVGSPDCASCKRTVDREDERRGRGGRLQKVLLVPEEEVSATLYAYRSRGWHVRGLDHATWASLVGIAPPLLIRAPVAPVR